MPAAVAVCTWMSITGMIFTAAMGDQLGRRGVAALLAVSLSSWLWLPWAVAVIEWNATRAGVHHASVEAEK